MKSSIVTLLLALAAVAPSMAADLKEDIVAVEKTSWKAFADNDVKAYGDTMTDDAVLASAAGNVYTGKQKIVPVATVRGGTVTKIDPKVHEVAQAGLRIS